MKVKVGVSFLLCLTPELTSKTKIETLLKVSEMDNKNCSILEITIDHEHDTSRGTYDPTSIKNDLLSGVEHDDCG